MPSTPEGKKYVVVYADIVNESLLPGAPGALGIYDTLADAAQHMLADIRDREAENSGYCETRYATTEGELWYDRGRTRGCKWKVVEL